MAHAEHACATGHAGNRRETSHDTILPSESCHKDNGVPKFGRENTGSRSLGGWIRRRVCVSSGEKEMSEDVGFVGLA